MERSRTDVTSRYPDDVIVVCAECSVLPLARLASLTAGASRVWMFWRKCKGASASTFTACEYNARIPSGSVIPSGAAQRRSRGIAGIPTEGPLYRDDGDSSLLSE